MLAPNERGAYRTVAVFAGRRCCPAEAAASQQLSSPGFSSRLLCFDLILPTLLRSPEPALKGCSPLYGSCPVCTAVPECRSLRLVFRRADSPATVPESPLSYGHQLLFPGVPQLRGYQTDTRCSSVFFMALQTEAGAAGADVSGKNGGKILR